MLLASTKGLCLVREEGPGAGLCSRRRRGSRSPRECVGVEGRASRVSGSGPDFTAFQIKVWTANPQQFVEDEDDDTFSYTVRIAAQDLLLVRASPASATGPSPPQLRPPPGYLTQAQRGRRCPCPGRLGVTGEHLKRSPEVRSQRHAAGSGSQANMRARAVPRMSARGAAWRHQARSHRAHSSGVRPKAELGELKTSVGLLGAAPRPLLLCSPALARAGVVSRLQFCEEVPCAACGMGGWFSLPVDAAGSRTRAGAPRQGHAESQWAEGPLPRPAPRGCCHLSSAEAGPESLA